MTIEAMNGLDLFSGYGGITLGLAEFIKPMAYCEKDKYAQAILLSRISAGQLPRAPIWEDIETFPYDQFVGTTDIIYGGFPCQDISCAGNGIGLAGKRSGLFFELCRLVQEINPRFIFLENVPAIRTRGLREVIRTLTDMGYDCRWTCVSAAEVGASHLRKRWFLLGHAQSLGEGKAEQPSGSSQSTSILADSNGERREFKHGGGGREKHREVSAKSGIYGKSQLMADSNEKRLPTERAKFEAARTTKCGGPWEAEPNVGRVVNGLAFRVDRIKALGNGVVPSQVKEAFERLIGLL